MIARILLLSMAAGLATASADTSVNVQGFRPVANSRFTLTESASGAEHGSSGLLFGMNYNYLSEPLVELSPGRDRRLSTLVESIQSFDLLAGGEIGGIGLYASLPVHRVALAGKASESALGDTRVFGRIPLVSQQSSPVAVSLIPELQLPSGDSSLFVSNGGTGAGLSVAIERDFGFMTVVGNGGYFRTAGAVFREMDYRQRLPLSLGVSVPITRKLAANAEGAMSLILPVNRYQNPSEALGGLSYQVAQGAVLNGGFGIGSALDRNASAGYRVVVGFRFTPPTHEAASVVASPIAPPAPQQAGIAAPAPAVELKHNRIEIGEEIRFMHDSAELLPRARLILDHVAELIRTHQGELKTIDIEGHCNELGSDGYNLGLSSRRAASVRAYLASQGIQTEKLNPVGYGKRRPKALEGQVSRAIRLQVNRRVEFKVYHQ